MQQQPFVVTTANKTDEIHEGVPHKRKTEPNDKSPHFN